MDLRRAERNLKILGDASSEDDTPVAHGVEETQGQSLFSESDEADAQDAHEDEAQSSQSATAGRASAAESDKQEYREQVFLSTQVQGRIDEFEATEGSRRQFRKLLTNFTYAREDGEANAGGRTAKRVPKVRRTRRRTAKVRSLTEFNTENFERLRKEDRARSLLTMLSGKTQKVNNLLKGLKQERSRDHAFQGCSVYNEEEWREIVRLLHERLPKATRSDVACIKSYVYGADLEENPWYASHIRPTDYPSQSQERQGTCELGDDEQRIFTLSQLLEDQLSASEETIPDSMDSGDALSLGSPGPAAGLSQTFCPDSTATSPLRPPAEPPAARTPTRAPAPPLCVRVYTAAASPLDYIPDSEDDAYVLEGPSQARSLRSPSLLEVRRTLKNIGVRPGRSAAAVRKAAAAVARIEAASDAASLDGASDADRRSALFQRMSALVRRSPRLLAHVYCLRPVALDVLRATLEADDDFIALLDDSLIRQWADFTGICVKNDTSDSQRPSQPLESQ
ncbi:AaceriAGR042Wp [[Ashbya] aceris (nom. inval.)]|nr:AaceriAGR042Wp [[Ashbya] aceris (nom. inval.)]